MKERERTIRKLLIKKKLELLAEIKKSMGSKLDEDVRLSFELLKDRPDKSVDELLKHVDARITENKSEELDAIDLALHKLEEGTCGVCEECGANIPIKRLAAVPSAVYCVNCQDVIDRTRNDENPRKERGRVPEGDNHIYSETE